RPVLALVDRLPRPQARALRAAFGEEDDGGADPDRFRVFLAALSLVAEAATDVPVLALVDDAHWLDDATTAALAFVARRALVELADTLGPAVLSGAEPLPTLLPATEGVERVFLDRARRLPAPARTLLLVAAADDSGQLATIRRAAATLGADEHALEAAERS